MESHDGRPELPHRTPTPLDALYNMGFRTPAFEIPAASAIGNNMFDMAVNMLAANLRGGNAATMAEFLQLALKAVETNGYGITYAAGPAGEFGLLVVPTDPETGMPDIEANPGDYALWCEMGTAQQVRETLNVAAAKQQESQDQSLSAVMVRDNGKTEIPTSTMDWNQRDLNPVVPVPEQRKEAGCGTHPDCLNPQGSCGCGQG